MRILLLLINGYGNLTRLLVEDDVVYKIAFLRAIIDASGFLKP